MTEKVVILGGGLAGCEAAFQLANLGIPVVLYEMRGGGKTTPAHITESLAELVCSNSFRSDELTNAVGILHEEMRMMGSLILKAADQHRIPAGSALAVDRGAFSAEITEQIANNPLITLVREEVSTIDTKQKTIIATGPLTSDSLSESIIALTEGNDKLAFFDAIAPIVYADSIDFNIAWRQSRYDKGQGDDYINCPLNKEEYYAFVEALINAPKTEFKEWELNTPYFNGCLPIEVMAERGKDTLRHGPMKPVGLTNKHDPGNKPYAVVQLRQDNKMGTLYNIVGFQTKMRYQAQKEVFATIPGLKSAEFVRFGGIHRNTFIKSPILLDNTLSLRTNNNIKFAGQITGVEGYLESAAIGLLAGLFMAKELLGAKFELPPKTTAFGALLFHIVEGGETDTFQPMNINFGLFDIANCAKLKGLERKKAYADRALKDIAEWKKLLTL